MTMRFLLAAVAAGLLLVPGAAFAEGDIEKGKKVFKKCRACHNVDNDKNKVGPHLVGIIGRKAGAVESYKKKYSKSLMAKAAEGLVWTEENLITYLIKPKAFIPKGKMAFGGLKKESQRIDLMAYLRSLQPEAEGEKAEAEKAEEKKSD